MSAFAKVFEASQQCEVESGSRITSPIGSLEPDLYLPVWLDVLSARCRP